MVTQTEQTLLAGMIFVIMFGMGAAMTPRDFILALKRPYGLFIALISQFGFMPLIAFTLATLLDLKPEHAIGLLIMGCVPGGTTSNIFTYFAKGNLALSVLMTINSTLFAFVLTPTMLFLYGSKLGGEELQIPMQNIAMTLAILLVPAVLGILLRRLNANIGAVVELLGGLLGILFIVFLMASWVPRNWQLLMISPWQVFAGAILLGWIGFSVGYNFCRVIKIHPVNAQTIAMEIGILNGPLAVGIVILSFADPVRNEVLLMPALYSLFIVISSSFLTIYWRRKNLRNEQAIPELL